MPVISGLWEKFMNKTLIIFLTSLFILIGCNDKNSASGETAEQKANREDLERKKAMSKTLDKLQATIDTLKNDFGVVLKHHPKATKTKIEADLSNLLALRFDPSELMLKSEDDLSRTIGNYLETLGYYSDSFIGMGGWITSGYENKEEFFKDISYWSIIYPSDIRNRTVGEWLFSTRNLYHACVDKTNVEQYALVSIFRSINEMDSADCLSLFEAIKDSTHLEITIPSGTKGTPNLVALRGMPLETLTITSEEPITLSLEGLEFAKDLKELNLKNIKVENLIPISNLNGMDSLVIDFPNLKRHLKNCPTKGENETLRDYCQNLGF